MAMKLTLPARKDGQPQAVDVSPGNPLVIIGANGAGKTRFARAVVDALGGKALHLNALNGLYSRSADTNPAPSSLRRCFSNGVISSAGKGDMPPTTLELLLMQLMHDEMLNLIGYKLALADGHRTPLQRTRLDKVIEIWQDVFPANRVLIDSGKLLFSRGIDEDTYSELRLSDGERAVLYYTGAILYAPRGCAVFVDSPELFLHPTLTTSLWNRLENIRNDCAFCYTTHDPEFATSRNGSQMIWVRDCDSAHRCWDYRILPQSQGITNEIYLTLSGSRKPVLFIEGEPRSIDAHLYPLIFPDYTVRSLGSCNKVIEATRTLNDLTGFHQMDSMGIVDRDRRNDDEVSYLRRKRVMVPDVAEVENIFLIEEIVSVMAQRAGKDAVRVVDKVRKAVMNLFRAEMGAQALMHTRHRMKCTVEYRVDARFDNIDGLEAHLLGLADELAPRRVYENFRRQFQTMLENNDYAGVLRVFNQKSMLSNCNVAQMCGFKNKDAYINGVLALLRTKDPDAGKVRDAVRHCLRAEQTARLSGRD